MCYNETKHKEDFPCVKTFFMYITSNEENRRDRIIMPDIYYEKLDKMFKELKIELEDTDDKKKIKEADNFIATFTPQKEPIKIE